jgi:hypothetical protein
VEREAHRAAEREADGPLSVALGSSVRQPPLEGCGSHTLLPSFDAGLRSEAQLLNRLDGKSGQDEEFLLVLVA